ncbi:putative Ig domain-containing protein [Colwellia psychrerythraea]|uniref:Dystroglycan-type cadherin-like domain-containing protein n=1 Tax=Colwellia psychrerythraea (strain 34H / ATCC BAA-681) TaxID=167879 RepID=Q482B8_COLP3|nr:putative Ig domain-containing protein [Colwellia psychrerythraea]AAZ28726.1 hypothetical protein CPS_2382 [Colwellia psychrerythraea 34H]
MKNKLAITKLSNNVFLLLCTALTFTPIANAAEVIELTIAEPSALKPDFIGYNANMMSAMSTNPWDRTELTQLYKNTGTSIIRYPGGTIANNFDWPTGNQIKINSSGEESLGSYDYKISNFKTGYQNAGFEPIFVVNLLTRDLQHTLDGLADATAKSLPINRIELGNEFFLKDEAYVDMFPSGQDYVSKADIWTDAIKAIYPHVEIAYVSTMKKDPRSLEWNEKISQCTKCDAIIIHTYTRSELNPVLPADKSTSYFGTNEEQNQQWQQFITNSGVDIMLAQPFEAWHGYTSLNNLPSDKKIWITEFNMKDGTGPTRNTWAHALFNANQLQSFLTDGRVEIALLHNLITGAKSGSHYLGNTFSGLTIDHGQGDLSSQKYSLSAGGIAMRAFGSVLKGMDTIAKINLSDTPTVSPTGYADYDAIYGWQGSNSANEEQRYLLINTSSVSYTVNTENLTTSNKSVRQYWTKPQTFIHSEEVLSGGMVNSLPTLLKLPAYSITVIGETAIELPSNYQQTLTLTATDDHFTKEANPNGKGQPTASQININNSEGDQSRPHIKFNTNQVKGSIESVTLKVYSESVTDTVSAHKINNEWDEYELTWNTMPTLGEFINSASADKNAWLEINVTASLLKSDSLLSFALTNSLTSLNKFSSKEGNKAPELIITTSNAVINVADTNITKDDANILQYYSNSLADAVSDDDNDKLSFYKTSGPSWLMLWSNGKIEGTPTADDIGENTFAIKVSDNTGQASATTALNLTINVISDAPTNAAPVWNNIQNILQQATENISYNSNILALATDADNDALIFAKVSGPDWLSLSDAGEVTGTATNSDIGENNVIVSVTDGTNNSNEFINNELIITVTAEIAVEPINNAPTWSNENIALELATQEQAYTNNIMTFTNDLDGDILVFAKVSGPQWLTLSEAGDITGTPSGNDIGENIFILSVTDSDSDTAQVINNTFTIIVSTKPEPEPTPKTEEDNSEGGSISFSLLLLCFLRVFTMRNKF